MSNTTGKVVPTPAQLLALTEAYAGTSIEVGTSKVWIILDSEKGEVTLGITKDSKYVEVSMSPDVAREVCRVLAAHRKASHLRDSIEE